MHQTFDRKVPITEQRLRVLLKKWKRKGKKNHSTGREAAAVKRARKSVAAHKQQQHKVKQAKRKAVARAYWSGDPQSMGLTG